MPTTLDVESTLTDRYQTTVGVLLVEAAGLLGLAAGRSLGLR
jgi:hypothetical protein